MGQEKANYFEPASIPGRFLLENPLITHIPVRLESGIPVNSG